MADQATFGIAIVGRNRTDAGARAAERRLGKIPKTVGDANRKWERESVGAMRRHTRSILRTFGEVEQAGSRIFGGRSITSGVTARLGGITQAARTAGTGLGEAATAGSALSGAIGAVGVAVGATVGILAAAGYAAFKLADGWAKGAASIGRTAEIIGVSTKALQEFTAAGERVGIDKDKSTGAIGSLSQTLNDARYGRNTGALEVLRRLGVGIKTRSDGTVDTEAMLPAIADALTKQNSSGRRTAAGLLGIPVDALPVFTQGGKALRDDMRDANSHAVVLSDEEIARGKRIQRKGAMVGQLKDRMMSAAGSAAADVSERGYDAVLSGGQAIVDGASDFKGTVDRSFRPAAEKIDRAANRMGEAMVRASGGAGRFTGSQIERFARKALPLRTEAMRYGWTANEATGIAANIMLESGGDHRAREKGGNGRGLIQWTDPRRKALFRRIMGVDVEHASRDQQWRFMRWETQNSEARNWRRATASSDPSSIAAGYARYVERPANKDRDSAERAAVAAAMGDIPVKVEIDMRGAPAGTKTKVSAGRGRPAVSHAYQHGN